MGSQQHDPACADDPPRRPAARSRRLAGLALVAGSLVLLLALAGLLSTTLAPGSLSQPVTDDEPSPGTENGDQSRPGSTPSDRPAPIAPLATPDPAAAARQWAGEPTPASVAPPQGTVQPVEPALPAGILYGIAAADSGSPIVLQARALATGDLLRAGPPIDAGGWSWLLAPDGRRAFLIEDDRTGLGLRITELALPTVQLVRQTLPTGQRLFSAHPATISTDGRLIFIETMGSRRHPGAYPTTGDDVVFGIAVYDVARADVVRTFPLPSGYCERLLALPDGDLLARCFNWLIRLDPTTGAERQRSVQLGTSLTISPDGRWCWLIEEAGRLTEFDLTAWRVHRQVTLPLDAANPAGLPAPAGPGAASPTPGAGPVGTPLASLVVPYHGSAVAADGGHLFVLTHAGEPGSMASRHGQVWVLETARLSVTQVIALAQPAEEIAPTPDGQLIVITVWPSFDTAEVQLIEVASGRVRQRWPGPLQRLRIQPAVDRGAAPRSPVSPSDHPTERDPAPVPRLLPQSTPPGVLFVAPVGARWDDPRTVAAPVATPWLPHPGPQRGRRPAE